MRSPDKNRPATKAIGGLLLLVGAGLVLFSLLADWLGVGMGEGFGYQQMIVLIVGIVLLLAGLRVFAQPLFNRLNGSQDLIEVER